MAKEVRNMPTTEYTIEPGKQEIISTVVLDAPRELVFKAYTDPKLFAQWWGPRQYTNHVEKFDSRRGGEWRVVQRAPDGGEHAFFGVHHEVSAPDRIVNTFEYEGVPGHVAMQIATFEPLGNKTRIVARQIFETVADRDGMVAAGMKSGADESMERLADLLEAMKAGK